jgi:transposase-like protein
MVRRTTTVWRELIDGQVTSGLAVAAFCARERIAPASFYRWRRSFQARTAGRESVRPPVAVVREPAFVDLGALTAGGRVELRLDLGRGVVLQLSCG